MTNLIANGSNLGWCIFQVLLSLHSVKKFLVNFHPFVFLRIEEWCTFETMLWKFFVFIFWMFAIQNDKCYKHKCGHKFQKKDTQIKWLLHFLLTWTYFFSNRSTIFTYVLFMGLFKIESDKNIQKCISNFKLKNLNDPIWWSFIRKYDPNNRSECKKMTFF